MRSHLYASQPTHLHDAGSLLVLPLLAQVRGVLHARRPERSCALIRPLCAACRRPRWRKAGPWAAAQRRRRRKRGTRWLPLVTARSLQLAGRPCAVILVIADLYRLRALLPLRLLLAPCTWGPLLRALLLVLLKVPQASQLAPAGGSA